jgi:putative transposase
VRYACIERYREEFPVVLMCRVLDVSTRAYYAWREREQSAREIEDARLLQEIRALYRKFKRRYGSPRIFDELQKLGIRTSRKRVERLMREAELRARWKRRFVMTTNSKHDEPIAPNLLDRRFSVEDVEPDQVWVSDITYVPTAEGWLFLAIVLDLASRRIVGWSTSKTVDTALTLSALHRALNWRRPAAGLVHHSDRGVQYAAAAYRAVLARHGAQASMSRKGNCWDNAVAESFFATLEWELIEDAKWQTREEAHYAIAEYIEIFYNRIRTHSSLGYLSPAAYEETLENRPEAA